jgi:peptide deformylase
MLELVYWPDPVLKQKCEPVPEVTDAVRWLLSVMEEVMIGAKGAGLAAPQVGRALRAITLLRPDKTAMSLVNPIIVSRSEETVRVREGCLSLPGFFEMLNRSEWVEVAGLDKNGEPVKFHADGLLGQACQHEVEHLDGVVFVDHLSPLKRGIARKRVEKELLRRFASEYEDADADSDDADA